MYVLHMTERHALLRILAVAAGIPVLAVGCASAPMPSAGSVAGPVAWPACELRPGPAWGGILEVNAPGAIRVGDVPIPTSPAERSAFRHLYETLVVVDCTGTVHPGLAGSWTSERDGRSWRFTLRQGAAFWDGTPVHAEDVLASWSAPASGGDGASVEASVAPARRRLRAAVAASAEVVSERTLRIDLDRPSAVPPAWLADPALAVYGPRSTGAWPAGTGSWRLHQDALLPGTGPAGSSSDPIVARPEGWTPGDRRPVLRFRGGSERDPREILDAGEDLLVTHDPAVLAYAATLPSVEALPLPWDRTYFLLAGSGAPGPGTDGAERALREALARDAVRAEVRASELPAGTEAGSEAGSEAVPACDSVTARVALEPVQAPPPPHLPREGGRIIYPRDDATARDLAERLVALAVGRPGPVVPGWVTRLPTVAEGLPDDAFATALRRRSEAAFVFPLPAVSAIPCALRLEPGRGWALRPLVDGRRRVIVSDDVAGLAVDGEGTLLLFGAGRTGESP